MTLPHGSDPVEELDAGGDRNEERHEREEREEDRTGDEHVVRPHSHGQSADRQGGEDHADVAEHRLAGEDRDDLGDDAEERQREDVDLGVAEEPEQVLPQDGATVGRVVDVCAELTVVEHAEGGGGEQREDQQGEDGGDQDVPGEDRTCGTWSCPVHAGMRMVVSHVDRRSDGTDTGRRRRRRSTGRRPHPGCARHPTAGSTSSNRSQQHRPG